MAVGDVNVNIVSPNARAGAFFDGVDDRITTGELGTETDGVPFSISIWVKLNKSGNGMILTRRCNGVPYRFWELEVDSSYLTRFRLYTAAGTYSNKELEKGLGDENWHHIVVTYDLTTLSLYVDGSFIDSIAGSTDITGTFLEFGIGSGTSYLGGVISETSYYLTCLTATQASQLYTGDKNIGETPYFFWELKDDYNDSIRGKNGTNSGTRLGIFDDAIDAQLESNRVNANDTFLMCETGSEKQVIISNIHESGV